MAGVGKDHHDIENNKILIQEVAQQDGKLVSPIDLSLDITKPLYLERLKWVNFDEPPAKMKLTNTGETVILSGKWATQRPYLAGGPLDSNYVFSQIHFHWGSDEHEGSEHTVKGICYPMEVHVVFYKTRYLTQEAALKKDDGIVIVVYLFKLQNKSTNGIQWLASHLSKVVEPQTSTVLPLSPLSALLVPFTQDYLLYWGSLVTKRCAHTMLWLVSRAALSINVEDLNAFRKLLNSRKEAMNKNFRGSNPTKGRSIFHVNPSAEKNNLLLPGVADPPGQTMIVNFTQMPTLNREQARQIFSRGDASDNESEKSSAASKHSVKTGPSKKNSGYTYVYCEGSDRESTNSNLIMFKESESSPERVSPRVNKDEALTQIKNQKKKNVSTRKMLENERREELEKTELKLSKNSDEALGNKRPALKSAPINNKGLLSRTTQPYIVRKQNVRRAPTGKSIPILSLEGDKDCLHYGVSQKSNDSGSASARSNKPAFKSRIPVTPGLQSSLAQYFTRPETASSTKSSRTVLNSPVNRPPTPMHKREAIKHPIASSIPRPYSPHTSQKPVRSTAKPILQKQCSD